MANARYFAESDYDLTLRLQELFHDAVDLQARLDQTVIENTKLKEERNELSMKLRDTHNEISRLVMNMRHLLSDTETVTNKTSSTVIASSRNVH